VRVQVLVADHQEGDQQGSEKGDGQGKHS
jgi:hypothetical protein